MILRRLAVRNYGCLADGEWCFAEGVNVVCGPNEAGKSTLAEAIAQVLLSSAPVTTTRGDLVQRKTWGRQEMYRLEADFSHGGADWHVVRDYAMPHETRLENSTTGEQVRDHRKMCDTLAEMARLTAGDAEQQYLATGYLRQGEWASVAQATGVTDLLAQAMEAASGKRLRAAIADLRRRFEEHNRGVAREAPKNPGPVAVARAALRQLKDEMEKAEGARDRARREEQARNDLSQAEEKLKTIEAELAKLGPRLEAATERRDLERDLGGVEDKLQGLAERIAQAEKLQGDIERWERELQSRRDLSAEQVKQLEDQREQADKLRTQATQRREAAASTVAQMQEREVELEKLSQEWVPEASSGVSPKVLFVAALLTLLGIALLGAALALGARLMLPVRIVLAVLGAAMALGGWIVVFRMSAAARARHVQLALDHERRAREVAAQVERMRGEAALLRQQADEDDKKAAELEAAVQAQLQAWEMPDLASAREYAAYNENLRAQLRDARNKIEGALAGRELGDLRREHVDLQGRAADLKKRLSEPEMQAAGMSDAEYGQLRERVATLQKEKEEWTQRRATAKGWLEATRGAGEELLVLQERIGAAEAELAAAERRLKVLETTVKWIDEAMDRARQEAHETLAPTASRFLDKLTAGRHKGLSLDAKLAPSIDTPEKGEPAAPDELSYATREQVYLALRLAMCEALWPEEGPPLILDEPLLAFDETRKAAALELLRDLAQRRQIIILTCSHDYDSIAANRIELGCVRA